MPRGQAALAVALHGVGGHGDDRHPPRAARGRGSPRSPPDRPCRAFARPSGQRRSSFPGSCGLPAGRRRRCPPCGRGLAGYRRPLSGSPGCPRPAGSAVAAAAGGSAAGVSGSEGSSVANGKPDGEVEGASASHLALDPNTPVHQATRFGRSSTQPGAAKGAPGRGVGLGEGLEDVIQVGWRNADSRVADGEFQSRRDSGAGRVWNRGIRNGEPALRPSSSPNP